MFYSGHLAIGLLIGEIAIKVLNIDPLGAFIAVGLGSILPGLDIFMDHRKTFHYPKIPLMISLLLFLIFIPFNVSYLAFAALFFLGLSLHCWIDVLGSGKELRPWEGRERTGVYDHIKGRYIEAKRIYYNGSLDEIAVTLIMSITLLILRPVLLPVIVLCVVSSLTYRYANRYIADRAEKFDTWSQLIEYQIFGRKP